MARRSPRLKENAHQEEARRAATRTLLGWGWGGGGAGPPTWRPIIRLVTESQEFSRQNFLTRSPSMGERTSSSHQQGQM
eukprot:scaffold310180_cov30-Tisochrysis_lutea.AAC.6